MNMRTLVVADRGEIAVRTVRAAAAVADAQTTKASIAFARTIFNSCGAFNRRWLKGWLREKHRDWLEKGRELALAEVESIIPVIYGA